MEGETAAVSNLGLLQGKGDWEHGFTPNQAGAKSTNSWMEGPMLARVEVSFRSEPSRTFSAMGHKFCPLFLLLLLHYQGPSMSSPILKYGCRPGTLQECKDAKFVPGHTLLGEGFDIVTMRTTGAFLLDLQEVEDRCTVCDNPHSNNILQKLPKALVDWRPESSCARNIQSSVSQSKVSIANEAASQVTNDWKVGLKVKAFMVDAIVAVGGSHSKMAKFADSKSTTDNYNFVSHKLQCSFYSFGLGSNASFTPHFIQYLAELPDSYDNKSKAEYRRLIDKFGTHYITHVKVGGQTQEVTAVRTCEVTMKGLKMDEVKDCLSVEAEIGISQINNSGSINPKVEHCKEKSTKARFGGDFHQTFNEREWEVTGGNATFELLSKETVTADIFKRWMESLKTNPGLVSYSLDSIHNLVKIEGPKKENLRLAISDYINEMALIQKCPCYNRHVGACSCSCPASRYTDSNCCPTHQGAAKLHVTIKDATGLRGDLLSETDAYVRFLFDKSGITSPTIQNDNNPTWNAIYDLGVVEISATKKFTIEVWDEDKQTPDDLLGKCDEVLTKGDNLKTCYLDRGSITYSVNVRCADHLQGLFCQDYVKVPPRY
ncbi:perforin-1-like [Leptodactylus fuscus]|uniref:perforin-1-like n=1 Tax=Leptodactylus fuscus TaxID=238119 RepID=UPI003F4E8CC5